MQQRKVWFHIQIWHLTSHAIQTRPINLWDGRSASPFVEICHGSNDATIEPLGALFVGLSHGNNLFLKVSEGPFGIKFPIISSASAFTISK